MGQAQLTTVEKKTQQLDSMQRAECINAVNALLALGDALALLEEEEAAKGTVNNLGYLVMENAKAIHEILEGDMNHQGDAPEEI